MIYMFLKGNRKNERSIPAICPYTYSLLHPFEYLFISFIKIFIHTVGKLHPAVCKSFSPCKAFILPVNLITVSKPSQDFINAFLVFKQTLSRGQFYTVKAGIEIPGTRPRQVVTF